jgi:hypothetical protein
VALGASTGEVMRRVSILVACVLSTSLSWSDPAPAQDDGFRGWVSLVAKGRVGWLENENLLSGVPRIQWTPSRFGLWAASNWSGLTPPKWL